MLPLGLPFILFLFLCASQWHLPAGSVAQRSILHTFSTNIKQTSLLLLSLRLCVRNYVPADMTSRMCTFKQSTLTQTCHTFDVFAAEHNAHKAHRAHAETVTCSSILDLHPQL